MGVFVYLSTFAGRKYVGMEPFLAQSEVPERKHISYKWFTLDYINVYLLINLRQKGSGYLIFKHYHTCKKYVTYYILQIVLFYHQKEYNFLSYSLHTSHVFLDLLLGFCQMQITLRCLLGILLWLFLCFGIERSVRPGPNGFLYWGWDGLSSWVLDLLGSSQHGKHLKAAFDTLLYSACLCSRSSSLCVHTRVERSRKHSSHTTRLIIWRGMLEGQDISKKLIKLFL